MWRGVKLPGAGRTQSGRLAGERRQRFPTEFGGCLSWCNFRMFSRLRFSGPERPASAIASFVSARHTGENTVVRSTPFARALLVGDGRRLVEEAHGGTRRRKRAGWPPRPRVQRALEKCFPAQAKATESRIQTEAAGQADERAMPAAAAGSRPTDAPRAARLRLGPRISVPCHVVRATVRSGASDLGAHKWRMRIRRNFDRSRPNSSVAQSRPNRLNGERLMLILFFVPSPSRFRRATGAHAIPLC